jgi:hypothetical protein
VPAGCGPIAPSVGAPESWNVVVLFCDELYVQPA